MMIVGLALAAALSGGDPDGVVATARPTPLALGVDAVAPEAPSPGGMSQDAIVHGLTTDQQIDRWISARAPDQPGFSEPRAEADDRRMHGYVEAGIGTGGYRSYGGGVSLPIGEEGRLDLEYRQSEGDWLDRYPYDRDRWSPYDRIDAVGARGRTRSFGVSGRWERQTRDPVEDRP